MRKFLLLTTAIAIPMMAAGLAQAKEAGDLLVRIRGLAVIPAEDADVSGLPGATGVEIDTAYVPEVDFTYFFTDNLAAELILATAKHNVQASVSGAPDIELGSVWLLPPTLTAQYHFMPQGPVSPYVGVGLNYTIFYGEDGPLPIEYDNSVGYVLQAGVDVQVREDVYFNIDLKRVSINTDVEIAGGAITSDTDINPFIVGAGFGITF